MAMAKDAMGKKMADAIMDANANDDAKLAVTATMTALAGAIIDYLKANMDVTTPTGQVIVAVTGQASGTPNPSPIKCTVQ